MRVRGVGRGNLGGRNAGQDEPAKKGICEQGPTQVATHHGGYINEPERE